MEKIIKSLASKYDLSEDVIEKIIRSQFAFVANTMSAGEFKSIRLHHLGAFAVKPKRLEHLQKYDSKE